VTTRLDFGCYRLVVTADDLSIEFQSRYQLWTGVWLLVGML
jgi:hypothetical protein